MQQQIDLLKTILRRTPVRNDDNPIKDNPTKYRFPFEGPDLDGLTQLPRTDLVNMLASKIIESNNQRLFTNIQNEVERKKHRLSIELIPSKTEIFKIVLTGGPCAGKTTAITKVAEQLREKGYTVFTVPEAATMLFQSGGQLLFENFSDEMIKKFQYYLMMMQMTLEDALAAIACNCGGKNIVLLCDRGTMDGSAYMPKKLWEELLSEHDLTLHKLRDTRYDLVIHISSAANGAEDFYSCTNNKARTEGLIMARDLDRKLQEAWIDHPNFVQINNTYGTFEEKMNSVIMTVYKFLLIPVSVTFYKKFLVANPHGTLIDILGTKNELNVHNFQITDIIFFKGKDNKELSYFRKRV